jgi:hypothetical protein
VETVVAHYGDAQIDALKRALIVASIFALVALWLAGDLPGAPLARSEATEPAESAAPAAAAGET